MSLITRVVTTAHTYGSKEAFKQGDIVAYRVAQNKGLLPKLFPTHTCALPPNFEELGDQVRALSRVMDSIRTTIELLENELSSMPAPMPAKALTHYRRGLNMRVLHKLKGK